MELIISGKINLGNPKSSCTVVALAMAANKHFQ